jgi:hypothetical protein
MSLLRRILEGEDSLSSLLDIKALISLNNENGIPIPEIKKGHIYVGYLGLKKDQVTIYTSDEREVILNKGEYKILTKKQKSIFDAKTASCDQCQTQHSLAWFNGDNRTWLCGKCYRYLKSQQGWDLSDYYQPTKSNSANY